jgi:hypothetical protein
MALAASFVGGFFRRARGRDRRRRGPFQQCCGRLQSRPSRPTACTGPLPWRNAFRKNAWIKIRVNQFFGWKYYDYDSEKKR